MDGQYTIFSYQETPKKLRPCDYKFKRYLGQHVDVFFYPRVIHGTITEIKPYYTYILGDDGELYAGTPINTIPAEREDA